ncbi:MAG: bifunctional diaminohydroxyphosphoribosylaminopyrimidine deaminase/5-amino-6-(5-phosphoribosylamino)uracil reductase RibD [Planctomycetota bacterium]|nr:bifunctional diaminohydroxyphosphoribosylaminopyrimidine deaminase/5-amino-6-(5-phosphoribosylamino)uracil reductase RibD [Planctomycetota bacterium]
MNRLTETLDPALARHILRELGEEAREHRFEVAPNPCVGAAVLSGSSVVARGFHRAWGGPHAEVEALRMAAESPVPAADWDTMLVTLEPCSSTGKTPPCVEAIKAAGIRRVIVAAQDPDPRHRGAGLDALRQAGIEVLVDPVAAPLEVVSPHFLAWNDYERRRRPRPWTIAKWAQTLSGHLSPPEDVGDGRRISGAASLQEVHLLRSRVDAVVTGVGTVLHDDPRLTVRLRTEASAAPISGPERVVLDSWLRTPPEARLFEAPGEGEFGGPVHIMAHPGPDPIRRRALEGVGARVHGGRGMDRHTLDLRDLWTWLSDRGFERVMLEAGPTLLRNALEEGFVDQVRVYTGNVRGGEGESLASWLEASKLTERLHREAGADGVLEAFLG